MKLLNTSRSPKYSQAARASIQPGCASRDLDVFKKAFGQVRSASMGFRAILSDADLDILLGMVREYLLPALSESDVSSYAGLDALKAHLEDPGGVALSARVYKAWRDSIQAARAEIRRRKMEKEAPIRAESNIIGPDGNPVPKTDVSTSQEKLARDAKPVLHPEMSTDLKSVIENNLAIMRTASGQPMRGEDNNVKTVVARPGGTPVPTDPAYYQKHRPKTPGMPE